MDRSTEVAEAGRKTVPAPVDRPAAATVRPPMRIDADAIAARLLVLGWPERLL